MKKMSFSREVMMLASEHEAQEMHRYRRFAFAFLTFHSGISRLMAVMGMECERRLEKLASIAPQKTCQGLGWGGERWRAASPGNAIHHSCILDRDMALEARRHILAYAEYSLRFYEHMLAANTTPDLERLLAGMASEKLSESRFLEDSLSDLLHPARTSRPL